MADNLPATLPRLAEGFARLPARNKVGLLFALAACAAILAASWMWSRAPDWRVLFANLSDRDGGAIVGALAQMNVPYRFNDGGTAILVPEEQVHDARLRLAAQGLPRGGTVGFEVMENQKLGASQFQEQVAFQRALEGELARTIQALAAVQTARVHLAVPRASGFLREQAKPSASVLVNLYAGKSLERAQIAGIVHLVASSVAELPAKNVSVVDQSGALLSGPSDAANGGLDAGQLAYVQTVESGTVRRILGILEPMLGRGNARAQVSAEVDFTSSDTMAETFRPNQGGEAAAVRSSQSSESSAPGAGGGAAQGVPGAISNQPASPAAPAAPGQSAAAAPAGGAAAASSASASSTRRDSTTQYEVDRMVRRTVTPNGTLKRLSVAVVVNHMVEKSKPRPLTQEEISQVSALVKEAIGYSKERGDTLSVVNAAFSVEPTPPAVAPAPFYREPGTLSMLKEGGKLAALAALVLYVLFGVVKPMIRTLAELPPAQAGEEAAAALAPAGPERLQAARQLARQDPKIVANVVKTWVAGNE